MKWAIRAVGADELDFRFSTLQPIIGFKHFKDGVSTLKQVTGRTHRDVERYIVGVIAGKAPPSFVVAIRALMDFRCLAQSRLLNDNSLSQLSNSLELFHKHKQTILDIGARVGKRNKRMDHFQIPKLELMHGVVPSVIESGAVIQWSADRTEHAHITEIKVPGRSGNNQDHNPQICRWLDRSEKHHNFSLALQLRVSDTDPTGTPDSMEPFEDDIDQPNDPSLARPPPDSSRKRSSSLQVFLLQPHFPFEHSPQPAPHSISTETQTLNQRLLTRLPPSSASQTSAQHSQTMSDVHETFNPLHLRSVNDNSPVPMLNYRSPTSRFGIRSAFRYNQPIRWTRAFLSRFALNRLHPSGNLAVMILSCFLTVLPQDGVCTVRFYSKHRCP